QQAGFGAASLQAAAPAAVAEIPALPADITPAQLPARRPDVIAAEARVAATQARIGVARDEFYPHLTLGALLGGQSLHGALFSAAAFQPQALLGLRWRLFDFGRVDAEVAQARGARAEALAALRQRMLGATEEVENALVLLANLEAQQTELVQEVDAHRSARDAAADAYRGGALSLIEVLQEDRLLLAANDQLARLQADRARAAVAAFRALGGGWSS
ncbi:TolC family protein, partial [Pelomonas sp. KK5]|uniref:TolC family protein n=1 Tax=Pelomonas sp. KK5 TaxID=1855730 RepID=UPI001301AE09